MVYISQNFKYLNICNLNHKLTPLLLIVVLLSLTTTSCLKTSRYRKTELVRKSILRNQILPDRKIYRIKFGLIKKYFFVHIKKSYYCCDEEIKHYKKMLIKKRKPSLGYLPLLYGIGWLGGSIPFVAQEKWGGAAPFLTLAGASLCWSLILYAMKSTKKYNLGTYVKRRRINLRKCPKFVSAHFNKVTIEFASGDKISARTNAKGVALFNLMPARKEAIIYRKPWASLRIGDSRKKIPIKLSKATHDKLVENIEPSGFNN